MASLDDYETSYSRNFRFRGKKFYGVRVYEGTKAELEVYATSYAVDSGNIWPGYATEGDWASDHGTYSVADTVQGDGSPDSYVYVCFLQHTAAADKEPPNATYWSRVQYAPFIQAYALEPMRRRPGKHRLRTLYEKPQTRDVLRRNPGQAILEINISAEAVKVLEEPVGPPRYSASITYVVGDRVAYANKSPWSAATAYTVGTQVWGDGSPDANSYECILAGTDHEPPNAVYWKPVRLQSWVCIATGINKTPGAAGSVSYWRKSSNVIEGPAVGTKHVTATLIQEGTLVWERSATTGETVRYRCIKDRAAAAGAAGDPGYALSEYWQVADVKWVPLNGSNTRLRAKTIIRLVSVTSILDPDTHIGKIGYTNSATVPKMGNFANIGTLLFIGYKTRKNLAEDGLSDVEYYFLYDPNGWAGETSVQRMRKVPVKQAVLNEDGTDSGDTARVVMWMPDPVDDAVLSEVRSMTKGLTSFAAFNAMLEWDT